MSNRGIFEAVPESSNEDTPSPSAAGPEPKAIPEPQPQTPKPSPFTVIDEVEERPAEPQRVVKIPEKRRPQSPFQIAEHAEGFGFMPPAQGYQGFPPGPFPTPYPVPASPFAPAADMSMFGAPAYPSGPAYAPAHAYAAAPGYGPVPPMHASAFQAPNHPYAPSSSPAPATSPTGFRPTSDSTAIHQLELRAIFGVDRELGIDEILQRCRSLPGVRQVAMVDSSDLSAIEALQKIVERLGYGSGSVTVHAGQTPVEFIHAGQAALAVQSEGAFGPGVRETLMIAAREISKLV